MTSFKFEITFVVFEKFKNVIFFLPHRIETNCENWKKLLRGISLMHKHENQKKKNRIY